MSHAGRDGGNTVGLNIEVIKTSRQDVRAALAALRRRLSPQGDVVSQAGRQRTIAVFGEPLTPIQVVDRICHDVMARGTEAVLEYTLALDNVRLAPDALRVPEAELVAAHTNADQGFLESVRRIRANILEFQQAILHQDVALARPQGVRLEQRYTPLRRVGLCVPGGAAAYPSSVLMTAVPAQAAGVQEIALVAPPTDFGSRNPDILATCHELGIREVYRVGGAQAVAALAYGTDQIQPVDKIVGPGNIFVALAKQKVYGQVAIDSIAGPSEVVVIADHATCPAYTAADMLAQAEHAPGSSVLITCDASVLEATLGEMDKQIGRLNRAEVTRHALEDFSALVLTKDMDEACQIANEIAPEHLHIAVENGRELVKKIPNAGATFVGPFSPVAIGDYFAGPSHVLPTGGTARWASGLSANDFLRSSSVIEFTEQALANAATDVERIALREQLTAHWESVAIRLKRPSNSACPTPEKTMGTNMKYRPEVLAMDGYAPGEQPPPGKFIKLNTNENPYPASRLVMQAIQSTAQSGLARYPDPLATAFRESASEALKVPAEWILCGNGSDDILTIVTRTFVGPGEKMRVPMPTYSLYKTLAEIQGAVIEEVRFDENWCLSDAFGHTDPDLRLAILANPNSPSGTVLTPEEVLSIANRLPCPLLVDEAYVDFAGISCLSLVRQTEKILVSRTLSKSYALAGLRFGFVVAQPQVIQQMGKVKDSYNCDALAIAAATAAIADQNWLSENRQRILDSRERFRIGLEQLGFVVAPSQANFLWCVHPDVESRWLFDQLRKARILIRYMNYDGWGDGLRITIGTDAQLDACLDQFKTLLPC